MVDSESECEDLGLALISDIEPFSNFISKSNISQDKNHDEKSLIQNKSSYNNHKAF